MAARLADVSATLELGDGSLALKFADGHDSLADCYRRLEPARA